MDPYNLGIFEVARALQLHPIQHGLSSYQYGAVSILKPRLLCSRKKRWPPEDRDIFLCKIYPQFDYPLPLSLPVWQRYLAGNALFMFMSVP